MVTKRVCVASTTAIVVVLLSGCSPPSGTAPGADHEREARGLTDEANPDIGDDTGGTGVTPPGDSNILRSPPSAEESRDIPFGWGQPSEKREDESGEVTDETAGVGVTAPKP